MKEGPLEVTASTTLVPLHRERLLLLHAEFIQERKPIGKKCSVLGLKLARGGAPLLPNPKAFSSWMDAARLNKRGGWREWNPTRFLILHQ